MYKSSRLQNKLKLKAAHQSGDLSFAGTFPTTIGIEPTNHCNAKCPLCPTGADKLDRRRAHMELPLFTRIVDEIAPYTGKIIMYNYGEPFLNPSIFEMIQYAKKHEMYIKISTNGTLFYNDEWIESTLQSGLDELIVSIDGADAATFNIYRRGLAFDRIVEGMRAMSRLKEKLEVPQPKIKVQFIAMKHNEHQVELVRQLAHSVNAEFVIKAVNLGMVDGGLEMAEDYLPDNRDLPNRYTHNSASGLLEPKHTVSAFCPIIWGSIMINCDGTVIPCCYDYQSDWILGKIPENSIAELWSGKEMTRLRKSIHTNYKSVAICRACSVATMGTPDYSQSKSV